MTVFELRYLDGDGEELTYIGLLDAVRDHVASHHAREMYQQSRADTRDTSILQRYIERYLIIRKIQSPHEPREALMARLISDMAGFSILDQFMDLPGIEEININGWQTVWVNIRGEYRRVPETFYSPQHCTDVIRRMLQRSDAVIDDANPVVTAEIREGVRIAACKTPVMDEADGMSASIRFVNPSVITQEQLLASGSATEEIIDFLVFCIRYGASVVIAGKTGSGKTTIGNWIVQKIAEVKRFVTIEEGSREINLRVEDSRTGEVINDVVHMKANETVSQKKLMQMAMRYHPQVIFVGEMRGDESFIAQEAARTGHVVLTTIHSNDAESTPEKMATLSQTATTLHYDELMRLMVKAFPLTVYVNQLEDGSRRIMEIMENEDYRPGDGLRCRSIYRFEVEDNIRRADGGVEVVGEHRRVGGISDKMVRKLLDNGAPRSQVKRYVE